MQPVPLFYVLQDVKQKTVLFQLRVRNVIAEQPNNKEIVAEEMWLWGYEGEVNQKQFLDKEGCP